MAPEQISNKALGPPTDQFSLAVLAYELLTGAKPFEGDSISGLLYSIVFESHVQVRSLNPTLPEAVELVFAKALAKDPLNRYPNCAAFAKALKAACETRKTWKPVRTVRGSQLSVPSDLAGVGGTMPAWGSESQTPPPTGTEPTLANTPFPPIASAVPMPSAPPQVAEVPRPVVEPSRHESVFQPVELAEKPPQNVKADEAPKPAPEKTKPPQTRQPAVEDGPSPQPAPLSSPKAKPADKKKILIAFAASFVVIVGGYLFWQSRKPVETAPAVAAEIPGSTAPVSAPPVASPPQTNKSPTPPPPVAVAGGAPAAPAAPAPFPVEVRTQPAGATVSVKEQKCVTPCQLDLNAGEHYVKAELDGYKDAFQMIQVPKMLELSVQLQKPMGTIEVRGPAGATIYVNGKPWATKAPARFQLEQGKYTLVLEHAEGGKSPEQVVDLTEGKIITLN